ncbi:MAG: AMP-binding protein, partial [Ignavibacteriaceae bacterium]|nr:AMP-binding protein [Ignavibacteriaceae bacterium]
MNIFDYFFLYSKELKKDFVLGPIERISFFQLYERASKLANYIKKELGENENIILMSHNSVFFLVAYLGIMKSGNVCVPLNPLIEQENLDYIINTTACKYFFIPPKTSEKYTFADVFIIDETKLDSILNS